MSLVSYHCSIPLFIPWLYYQGKSKNKNMIFINRPLIQIRFYDFYFYFVDHVRFELLFHLAKMMCSQITLHSPLFLLEHVSPYVNSFQILGDEVTIWTYSLYKRSGQRDSNPQLSAWRADALANWVTPANNLLEINYNSKKVLEPPPGFEPRSQEYKSSILDQLELWGQ